MRKIQKSNVSKIAKKMLEDNTGLAGEAMDAFSNPAARMGYGTSSLAEATEYELIRWTNNYWLMITLFRNHWISRRIVEKPAQDMCKAWPVINSSKLTPEDISLFDRTLARTHTAARIKETIKWARLFGGAGALIVIDGHEGMMDKQLRLDDINPGSYKGLIVFDRWSGITPSTQIAEDINSPVDFNTPLFYTCRGESGDSFDIHHSRILRFIGPDVPRPENQAQMHWGISELEIAYEEIRKRDNASWSILSLMFRAQILAQKNPALAQMLSGVNASQGAMRQFQKTMQAQNELMSNQSMLLMGADSELQSQSYSFAGISDVYQQFQMDIAGAAKIPVSILFGRTATGLGQSNDSDIRIYEQEIAQKQHEELKPQLDKLYPVICMSQFGEVPDDLDFTFPSIRVLTEEQKSEITGKVTEAILAPYNAGITAPRLTLQELKATSDMTGIFTNITDEMIEAADDKPQPPIEAGTSEGEDTGGEGNDSAFVDEYQFQGLNIAVETRSAERRFGKDFSVVMPADYGFIKGTIGADGDEMDCYVGTNPQAKMVYVVNQSKLDAEGFDEHKCMLGFSSQENALNAYLRGHHRGKEILMGIVPMSMPEFKQWLRASHHSEPAGSSFDEFIESDHPRDEMGRFGSGAGHSSEARQAEITRLHEKHSEVLSTPLYSEGEIGPAQTARFSQAQFKALQEKQQIRMELERHIKKLGRSDEQIKQADTTAALQKIESKRLQLTREMDFIKGLGTMSHKSNGDLKKGYQIAWNDCTKKLAALEVEEQSLNG